MAGIWMNGTKQLVWQLETLLGMAYDRKLENRRSGPPLSVFSLKTETSTFSNYLVKRMNLLDKKDILSRLGCEFQIQIPNQPWCSYTSATFRFQKKKKRKPDHKRWYFHG